MKSFFQTVCILLTGAGGYCLLEIMWRGYTHWSMAILGGICFLMIISVDNFFYQKDIVFCSVLGAILITLVEFMAGWFFNLYLHMNVWDYSDCFLNIKGQVCLLYSALWFVLCYTVIFIKRFLFHIIRHA